jgi:hypothetical protein
MDSSFSLDIETFKEVLEWLPSDLRLRIIDRANIEKVGLSHPAVKWAVFIEEKESEIIGTSPNKNLSYYNEEEEHEKSKLNNSMNKN